MGWVKLLLPVAFALLKWLSDKNDARKWKQVAQDEKKKRMAHEREHELARRAAIGLDERRRGAGWAGDGDPRATGTDAGGD